MNQDCVTITVLQLSGENVIIFFCCHEPKFIKFLFSVANGVQSPFMNLDSSKSSTVYGESNVLRFLSRLLQDQSYEKSLSSIQVSLVDDLIDSCSNQLKNSKDAKLNSTFLKSLNEKLKKSKFLVLDNSVTVADIYVWSVLRQRSKDDVSKNFKNVGQWLNNIESIELFQIFQ
jgi:hypothetical protein